MEASTSPLEHWNRLEGLQYFRLILKIFQIIKNISSPGQQQFVLHQCRLGALGDAGLDVVGLDPLGEPAHVAITVEGVGAKGAAMEIYQSESGDNRFCLSMEATYPDAIKNHRKARNAPTRPLGDFGCLKLVLYGIRELAR